MTRPFATPGIHARGSRGIPTVRSGPSRTRKFRHKRKQRRNERIARLQPTPLTKESKAETDFAVTKPDQEQFYAFMAYLFTHPYVSAEFINRLEMRIRNAR